MLSKKKSNELREKYGVEKKQTMRKYYIKNPKATTAFGVSNSDDYMNNVSITQSGWSDKTFPKLDVVSPAVNAEPSIVLPNIDHLKNDRWMRDGYEFDPRFTADDLLEYVPAQMPVDGDDCQFNMTMMTIDGRPQVVVTYDRIEDNYTCLSFFGDTMADVFYEVIKYAND